MPTTVGLNIWSRFVTEAFPYLDQVVAPFDSLWFPDHVQYGSAPVAEGWTMLVFALGRYPDKICSHEVLCNNFRNPAHLAKMAATAQAVSGGRFVLGIGAGWNEEEYQAYGWPFPRPRVRIAQLAETIQLIRRMWTDSPASFRGEYYQIADAHCEPRPDPPPPVMVGGSGEQYLLRCVAQHADWWNHVFSDRETYSRKQEVLKMYCGAVGRDYGEIKQVVRIGVLIAETESSVRHLQEQPWVRPMDHGASGTPVQVTEMLLDIIDQGAHQLTVHFADAPRAEGTHLFADSVLPHLRR